MAYSQNEIKNYFLSIAEDYITNRNHDYLRAIVRNEYCGAVNHHVATMTTEELLRTIHRNISIDRQKQFVWWNSTKTHGTQISTIREWAENC